MLDQEHMMLDLVPTILKLGPTMLDPVHTMMDPDPTLLKLGPTMLDPVPTMLDLVPTMLDQVLIMKLMLKKEKKRKGGNLP